MNSPLVSVIVPVYNVAPYLEQCLDSIVNQTYRNLEIILVDDGSTDESGAICDRYAEQDSRIKVVHKENGGQSSARNVALDMMTGEWVLFVDSDDWIELNTLELLFEQKDERADIVEFGFVFNYPDKEKLHVPFSNMLCDTREALTQLVVGGNFMGIMCDKLFRASVLREIRFIEGRCYEDTPFVIEALWAANWFQYIPQALYHYRQGREDQTTYDMSAEKQEQVYQNLEYLMEKYSNDLDLKLYLSTWYLTKTKQDFFISYIMSNPERSKLTQTLGVYWNRAYRMPFISLNRIQQIRMKAFQFAPRLYAFLVVHVQPLVKKLIGK